MPTVKAPWGGEFFAPSRDEYVQMITDAQEIRERASVRAWKWMRLPVYTGTPASSAVTIDEKSNGFELGPQEGYAWALTRIVIDGMTSGSTPDEINMYRNSVTGQPPLWQFNGNNFAYTWGKLRMTLMGGDTLKFASTGTFSATGLIRVTGELIEVPAEQLGLLA